MTCPPNLGSLLLEQPSGMLQAIDAQAASLLKIDASELERCNLREVVPGLTEEKWAGFLDQNDKQSREISTLIRGTDGCEQKVKLRAESLSGLQQDLLLLTIYPAIEEQNQIFHHDALTGLPDRRALVVHHQRWQDLSGEETVSFAVLFMDLDQFKQINDQHGHAVGDQVLSTLAKRWQNCVREGDLVTRYGGDEFVVLLANIRNRADAKPVIARLTQVTSEPIRVGDGQLSLGVTIGIALANSSSSTLEELIATADRDMYALRRNR